MPVEESEVKNYRQQIDSTRTTEQPMHAGSCLKAQGKIQGGPQNGQYMQEASMAQGKIQRPQNSGKPQQWLKGIQR